MGKTIAVANQKGGVGKTTTTVNLAAALTELGMKVLLCDLDPQANATTAFGVDKRRVRKTIYDVLINDFPIRDAIISTPYGDVIPSSAILAGAGVELLETDGRQHQLKNKLSSISDQYDLIFIDCPPSLEMLTLNSLTAANYILVPVQCEYYALEGVADLMGTMRRVKQKLNPGLEILGVALTMYDGRTNFCKTVAEELRKYFGNKVFLTAIPRNIRIAEAPSFSVPVTAHDPNGKGATAYRALAQEVRAKLNS